MYRHTEETGDDGDREQAGTFALVILLLLPVCCCRYCTKRKWHRQQSTSGEIEKRERKPYKQITPGYVLANTSWSSACAGQSSAFPPTLPCDAACCTRCAAVTTPLLAGDVHHAVRGVVISTELRAWWYRHCRTKRTWCTRYGYICLCYGRSPSSPPRVQQASRLLLPALPHDALGAPAGHTPVVC